MWHFTRDVWCIIIVAQIVLTYLTAERCPSQSELDKANCLCYPSLLTLICNGIEEPLFLANNKYEFQSLIIKNSSQLPFWNEYVQSNSFSVESLVVLQNLKVSNLNNLHQLLQMPTKEIKIISTEKTDDSLDLLYIKKGLTSISFNRISTIKHHYQDSAYYFDDQPYLESVQFTGTHFQPPIVDLFLYNRPLYLIRITDTNLAGRFTFIPARCPPDGARLLIDVRNNQLNYFDLASLFPRDRADCLYHLELSSNPLHPDLLLDQLPILKHKHRHLAIHMRGAALNCSCELQHVARVGNIHKLKCANFNGKLLNDIEFQNCNTSL